MSASSASLHPFANALAEALKDILGKDAGVDVTVQQAGETAHASKPAEQDQPAIGFLVINQFTNVNDANAEIVRLHRAGLGLSGDYSRNVEENRRLCAQVQRHKAATARSQRSAKMLAELTKRILAGESTEAERALAMETISAIEVAAAAVSIH